MALCISCSAQKIFPEVEKYILILEGCVNHEEEIGNVDSGYIVELDGELSRDLGDGLTCKDTTHF